MTRLASIAYLVVLAAAVAACELPPAGKRESLRLLDAPARHEEVLRSAARA